MFCKNCGVQLEEGTVFCPECGMKQDNVQEIIDVNPSEIKEIQEEEETSIAADAETVEETEEKNKMDEEKPAVNADNVDEGTEENADSGNRLISVAKMKYCHNCGAANEETGEFCYNCGTPFLNQQQKKAAKIKFQFKKQHMLAGLGVIALVVILIAIVNIVSGIHKSPALVYIKDNEVNVFLKKQPYVIGDNVYDDSDDADTLYDYLYNRFQTSEDGKYLFYPQDYDSYDGYNLYCRKLKGENEEEIKVDSGIQNYTVLSDNDVIYLKDGSSGKLYYSDLKDKRKIASDVSWFVVSANQKYVMWYTSDGDNRLYVQDIAGKNDRIKIDGDISLVYGYSDNFDKIVYRKEDYLYIMKNFEEKEKVSSDVCSVDIKDINGSLGIYYMVDKDDTVDIDLNAIIDDEYAVSDSKMTEPDIKDYQKTEIKDSFWGPMESVTTDDAYYDDLEKYHEKQARDTIREELGEVLSLDSTEVYYYSDSKGESQLLLEGQIIDYYCSNGINTYLYFDEESIEKISMGSLLNATYDELEDKLEKCLVSGIKAYLFNESNQTELNVDFEEYDYEWVSYQADTDSHQIYMILSDTDGEETYLFSTDYSKGDGKLELMAEDVNNIELVNANGVYYMGDVDEGAGTLYLNGKRIDDDVSTYSVTSFPDNKILYMTDMDSDYSVGTLNLADKTDKTRIADDVAQYKVNDKEEIAFLIDYNFKKYRGDLKLYKNGKTESIDTDVSAIVGFY